MVNDIVSPKHSVSKGSVIWITGYSGSGKTTIGRKVEYALRTKDYPTVFLDGDDLRGIFGHKWGFTKKERIELAKIYFRFCSHLSSQGIVVVLSAVCMYREIFNWSKQNVTNLVDIYLSVPEDVRFSRDAETKKLFKSLKKINPSYDIPENPSLVIENYGDVTPNDSTKKIVSYYENLTKVRLATADKGKLEYWENQYKTNKGICKPSDFAKYIIKNQLNGEQKILDLGCGNGRDSIAFAKFANYVFGIDTSKSAIDLCQSLYNNKNLQFLNTSIDKLYPDYKNFFDVIYSRFMLHSMTLFEEISMLNYARFLLKNNGKLLIECRSINDELARKGEVLSPTERIFGHYRRFIVLDELLDRLYDHNFNIDYSQESKGLAICGEDDPTMIRIIATISS